MLLNDENAGVRLHAARALAEAGNPAGVAALKTAQMEHVEEAQAFFAKPGRAFCMMSGESFDHLRNRGLRLTVVSEASGLNMTPGRPHTQDTPPPRRRFVIATQE